MDELERYKRIGTVEECRRAGSYYREHNKQKRDPKQNCKTCKKHNNCKTEKYSIWCTFYESRN